MTQPINPPSHDTGLFIENGRFDRGGKKILTAINLKLPPGTLIVLRGENGAGKTTLLRCCAGLAPMSEGNVGLTGPQGEENLGDLQKHVAFYGHANAVKAALSVNDNLKFWAGLYGATPKRVETACERLDLSRFLKQSTYTLSAGQRRRLGLCRLLLTQKPIWLLDEPTASMDTRGVDLFASVIVDHAKTGGSAIIATHDPLDIEHARTVTLSAPMRETP